MALTRGGETFKPIYDQTEAAKNGRLKISSSAGLSTFSITPKANSL